MPQPLMPKKVKLYGSRITTRPCTIKTKKGCPIHIGDWNKKVGSQEISGITGKFGLGV